MKNEKEGFIEKYGKEMEQGKIRCKGILIKEPTNKKVV